MKQKWKLDVKEVTKDGTGYYWVNSEAGTVGEVAKIGRPSQSDESAAR